MLSTLCGKTLPLLSDSCDLCPCPMEEERGCPQRLGTLPCPAAALRRAGDERAGQEAEGCPWTDKNTQAGRPGDLLPAQGQWVQPSYSCLALYPFSGEQGPWLAGSLSPGLSQYLSTGQGTLPVWVSHWACCLPKEGPLHRMRISQSGPQGDSWRRCHGLDLCWV